MSRRWGTAHQATSSTLLLLEDKCLVHVKGDSCAVVARQDWNSWFHWYQKPGLSERLCWKECYFLSNLPLHVSPTSATEVGKWQRNCHRSSVSSSDFPKAQSFEIVLKLHNYYLAYFPPLFSLSPLPCHVIHSWSFSFSLSPSVLTMAKIHRLFQVCKKK